MSRRVSPSTDQVYGLQRVTRIWGVSRATVYRHRHQPEAIERRRPGPLGAMADEELVRAIRRLLTASPFHGEGYFLLLVAGLAATNFAAERTARLGPIYDVGDLQLAFDAVIKPPDDHVQQLLRAGRRSSRRAPCNPGLALSHAIATRKLDHGRTEERGPAPGQHCRHLLCQSRSGLAAAR